MPEHGNARGRSTAGARGNDGSATSIAPGGATEDLVLELADRADWREAVLGLALSQRDSRELRIRILRKRVFAATRVGIANARARGKRSGARGAR